MLTMVLVELERAPLVGNGKPRLLDPCAKGAWPQPLERPARYFCLPLASREISAFFYRQEIPLGCCTQTKLASSPDEIALSKLDSSAQSIGCRQ